MVARAVDIVDDTFIRTSPAVARAFLDRPGLAELAWPGLRLEVVRDRGLKGVRWRITGAVEGSMEVWLEPWHDGVVVHHYVRGRAVSGWPAAVARRHSTRWKTVIHAAKDELEGRSLYPSGHG